MQRWLLAQWFSPRATWASRLAAPLAAGYGWLQRRQRQAPRAAAVPRRPTVVIGNLVVGGAGKTPTTVALIDALRRGGRQPGVVSRGYGRRGDGVAEVGPASDADEVGDEPLLLARRTGVPVVVGRDRVRAAEQLCARHPEVDVIVCDDGLQHRQLPRTVEVVVFDARGAGNGRLLPAGPLREPMPPQPPPGALVLYSEGRASTPWPGHVAHRQLAGVCSLHDWWQGPAALMPLSTLRGRPLLAMAGLAVPQRFFDALVAAGLSVTPLPLPDHHAYERAPWPAGTAEIVTTEKDAAKLRRWAQAPVRIWVVPLDLQLPAAFVDAVLARLPPPP